MSPKIDQLDDHIATLVDLIAEGDVVPFLGAGVNRAFRPAAAPPWSAGADYLPDGGELAIHLAKEFRYPMLERCQADTCPNPQRTVAPDLAKVTTHGEVDRGTTTLYRELGKVFERDYVPSPVHRLIARWPIWLAGRPVQVVTTNYDELMEEAFHGEKVDYDLVWYESEGDQRGRFRHLVPGKSESRIIEQPNNYAYPFFEMRPVVLKIHGTVLREQQYSSYVITEDHYVDYLANEEPARIIPKTLTARWTNLLFLGYSLRDFNFRVIVRRMQKGQRLRGLYWAIVREASRQERHYWLKNGVEVIAADLPDYIERLGQEMGRRFSPAGPAGKAARS